MAAAERLESAQVKKMVDQVWQTRLASGDPLEALLHTEQVTASSCLSYTIVKYAVPS